jgi:hypothetical protein
VNLAASLPCHGVNSDTAAETAAEVGDRAPTRDASARDQVSECPSTRGSTLDGDTTSTDDGVAVSASTNADFEDGVAVSASSKQCSTTSTDDDGVNVSIVPRWSGYMISTNTDFEDGVALSASSKQYDGYTTSADDFLRSNFYTIFCSDAYRSKIFCSDEDGVAVSASSTQYGATATARCAADEDQPELLTLLGAAELPTPLQYQHPESVKLEHPDAGVDEQQRGADLGSPPVEHLFSTATARRSHPTVSPDGRGVAVENRCSPVSSVETVEPVAAADEDCDADRDGGGGSRGGLESGRPSEAGRTELSDEIEFMTGENAELRRQLDVESDRIAALYESDADLDDDGSNREGFESAALYETIQQECALSTLNIEQLYETAQVPAGSGATPGDKGARLSLVHPWFRAKFDRH